MSNLPASIPQTALTDLRSVFVPEGASQHDRFELSIRITDQEIEVRDLSAFLAFVDDVYGRLSKDGLRSYAQRQREHLQITKMQQGSWELLLIETLASPHSAVLLIIFLALKYLPSGIQSLANAYNEVEQGRLARQNRKRIRKEMESDQKLSKLSARRRRQVAALIDELYEQEKQELPGTMRFVRKRLLAIGLRIRSANDEDGD